MKIKVTEATGPALDWLVWEIAGGPAAYPKMVGANFLRAWNGNSTKYIHPSTDWSQGGPIIERGKIAILPNDGHRFSQWHAFCWAPSQHDLTFEDGQSHNQRGPTPLIAAMRCFVASKLGDEAEVPDELTS